MIDYFIIDKAYHHIIPVVDQRIDHEIVNIVGPVCESSDYLGKERRIGVPKEGELLAILDTGAYCMSMAFNYNLRPKPPEIMIDGDRLIVIRKRDTYEITTGKLLQTESNDV